MFKSVLQDECCHLAAGLAPQLLRPAFAVWSDSLSVPFTPDHSHYFVQVTQQIVETGASVQNIVFKKSSNTLKIIMNFYKELPSKLSALSILTVPCRNGLEEI